MKMSATEVLVRNKKIKNFAVGIFKFVFIFGICYLFLFPILNMLITAFRPLETASDPTVVWIPAGFSLEGVKLAMEQLQYGKSTFLSAEITILSTIAALASCSLAGYGLARFKFPGKSVTMVFLILTIIVPPQVMYSSTYLLYRFFDFGGLLSIFGTSINLIESPGVFIVPSIFAAGLRNGLFVYIFYSFFKGLPLEMEEAAKIDGCGVFKTYIRVMAPMAVPAFITVLLFSLVWHWTAYQNSITYFSQEVRPIVAMLSSLQRAVMNDQLGLGSAGAVMDSSTMRIYLQAGATLCIAPPLILYLFFQKYFTESIERTGLVG